MTEVLENVKVRLYKFQALKDENDLKRLKKIIKTGKFWCSNFWDLNDPMEGVYKAFIDPRTIKRIFEKKSTYKICAFSGETGLNNLSLWGYYANGFKGIAIEILVAEIDIKKINYVSDQIFDSHNIEVIEILTRKLLDWQHENEYRFLTQSNKKSHKIGEITKVYFGNPYEGLNNSGKIIGKSKTLKTYNKLKIKLQETCDTENISWEDYDRALIMNRRPNN